MVVRLVIEVAAAAAAATAAWRVIGSVVAFMAGEVRREKGG